MPDGEAVTKMEAGPGPKVKLRWVTGLEAEGQGPWGGVEYRSRVDIIGGGGGGVHYGVWRRCGRASIVIGWRRGGIEEGGRGGGKVWEGAGGVGGVGSGGGRVGGRCGGEHSAGVRRIGELLDNWTHQQGLLDSRSQGKSLLDRRSNDKWLLG